MAIVAGQRVGGPEQRWRTPPHKVIELRARLHALEKRQPYHFGCRRRTEIWSRLHLLLDSCRYAGDHQVLAVIVRRARWQAGVISIMAEAGDRAAAHRKLGSGRILPD